MRTMLWDPWAIFDELGRSSFAARAPEGPVFDIEDAEDATFLSADVPGLTDEDLEVTVAGQVLMVRGERKAPNGRHSGTRWYGAFERRFQLGTAYDLDDVQAHVAHGVLTIRLAKTERARPRRIKLGTGVVDKVKGFLTGGKDRDKDRRDAAA